MKSGRKANKAAAVSQSAIVGPGVIWFPAWLLLMGCAVGPDYHGPPPEEYTPPAKFKNASSSGRSSSSGKDYYGSWKMAEPADTKSRSEWWKVFGDAGLDRCISETLAGNQDLRVAAARIVEAHAMDRIAAADFYPNIIFEGSAVRQRTSNTEPIQRAKLVGPSPFGGSGGSGTGSGTGGTGGGSSGGQTVLATQPLTNTFNLFRTPFDLNWELDLFGRVRRTYQASRAQTQSVEADFQNMTLSISANAAINYFSLRALDAELDVLDRTIKTRREGLRISQERLQAGLTSELDVVRAQADLASNEADALALQRTRGEVENAIATLLGKPASLVRFPKSPLSESAVPPRVPAGIPGELLERRPDIASAERLLAAANARIGVAKAAFFPVVRLTGAAGFESADLSSLFSWESRIWQIGPSVTLPIFEGGRNAANLEASKARYDQAVGNYRGQVLVAFQEVENALKDLQTLAAQSEAQNRAVEAARRALELSQQQYAKGSITFLDVLDSERVALADERAAVQLLGQRYQATVQLIKALGGGWR